MIGPYQLPACRIDRTKEELGLAIDRATATDLSHHRLWRKMGHDPMSGIRFLIADVEIEETFPEKLACGRVIDAKRERRQSVCSRADPSRKNPLTRLTGRRCGVLSHVQFVGVLGQHRTSLSIVGFHGNRGSLGILISNPSRHDFSNFRRNERRHICGPGGEWNAGTETGHDGQRDAQDLPPPPADLPPLIDRG